MLNTPEWRRQVRDAAKELIPRALRACGPLDIQGIYAVVARPSSSLCDDDVPCQHGGRLYSGYEWQHQVRWAVQDLKGAGIVRRTKGATWELA
jgi:hypothetical protein